MIAPVMSLGPAVRNLLWPYNNNLASERKDHATQKIFSGAVCRVIVNGSVISQRGCSHRCDMEPVRSGHHQWRSVHVRQRVNQHVCEYRYHGWWDRLLGAGVREADRVLG